MRSIRIMLTGGVLAAALAGIVFAQTYDPGTELAIVERVQKARSEYSVSLAELYNYYLNSGDASNAKRAERELGNLRGMEQYDYAKKVAGGEIIKPAAVMRFIEEAEAYYVDAKILADSRFKARKDLAIVRLEAILEKWADSARAPEACFLLGDLYAGLYYRDFDMAASYYKKAYDMNPGIDEPALVKAGDMYFKLQRYDDAVTMYKLAVQGSRNVKHKEQAEWMLERLSKMGH